MGRFIRSTKYCDDLPWHAVELVLHTETSGNDR
jgi:hypothetical protein